MARVLEGKFGIVTGGSRGKSLLAMVYTKNIADMT
jgi:hypothetical protein